MFDFFGYFNPIIGHRHSRVLRQHLPLLEFLMGITNHWHLWTPGPGKREKLEKEWAANHPDGGDVEGREHFIETGMAEYHASFRPKLIFLVYVIPVVLVAAIHVLTTYY